MSSPAGGTKARARALAAALLLFGSAAFCSALEAQRPAGRQFEARADAILSRATSLQAAFGVSVVAGLYVRPYAMLGAGVTTRGGETNPAGRVDLGARFHTDPFRESRWAPYAAGGLSARFEKGERAHGYLLVALGTEGPVKRGWCPAIEVGLGGGARLGLSLRGGRTRGR